jgi:hypothetical protein
MLVASAAALPVLMATAGCRSSDAFAGPDPLAGRPSLSPDVITLQAVIAAEQAMIKLYQAAVASNLATDRAGGLEGLLAQHRQHLGLLQARLVLPPGASTPTSSGAPVGAVPGRVTIARLRDAERASAANLVRRLVTVQPALAQLFASIAASDATHAVALGG